MLRLFTGFEFHLSILFFVIWEKIIYSTKSVKQNVKDETILNVTISKSS